MKSETISSNRDKVVRVFNGWTMLPIVLVLLFGAIALFIYSIAAGEGHPIWSLFVISILTEFTAIIMLVGFFALQPNEARVLVLFGAYKGTVREPGFHWGNPFYSNGPSQMGILQRAMELETRGAAGKAMASGNGRRRLSRHKLSLRTR